MRGRRSRPAALAGACIGIGLGLGAWQPGPALERALAPDPGGSPVASPAVPREFVPSRPSTAPAAAALRIFEVTPEHATSTGLAGSILDLGPEYRPESIRAALTTPPLAGNFGVYAAQRTDGRYCLVEQDQDGSGSSAACATADEIARRGLHLGATVTGAMVAGSTPTTFDLDIDWFPTGSIGARAVPHGSTPTPHSSPCETVRRARCGSTTTG